MNDMGRMPSHSWFYHRARRPVQWFVEQSIGGVLSGIYCSGFVVAPGGSISKRVQRFQLIYDLGGASGALTYDISLL